MRELCWDWGCRQAFFCGSLFLDTLRGSYFGDALLWNPTQAAVITQVFPAGKELIQGVLLRTVANVDAGCASKSQIHILSAKRSSSTVQKIRLSRQTSPIS